MYRVMVVHWVMAATRRREQSGWPAAYGVLLFCLLSPQRPSTARPGTSWHSTSSFLFFNISFPCCSTFLRPDHAGIRCHTVNIHSIIITEVYYLHAMLIRHCISRRGASCASLTRSRNSCLKLASDPLVLNNSEAHCSGCSTM